MTASSKLFNLIGMTLKSTLDAAANIGADTGTGQVASMAAIDH